MPFTTETIQVDLQALADQDCITPEELMRRKIIRFIQIGSSLIDASHPYLMIGVDHLDGDVLFPCGSFPTLEEAVGALVKREDDEYLYRESSTRTEQEGGISTTFHLFKKDGTRIMVEKSPNQ